MKWILSFLIVSLFVFPYSASAGSIAAGNGGAIIITDNGPVFVPHRSGKADHPGSIAVRNGSKLIIVPHGQKEKNARSQANITGVNSLLGQPGPANGPLLGTPGPGNGSLLGTPGPGVNIIETAPHKRRGFQGRHFRKK
jgi:hypothetical protein